MEAKQLGEWLNKASELHEESYKCAKCGERWPKHQIINKEGSSLWTIWECPDGGHGRFKYTKEWDDCLREAGMPEVWIALLAPYASLGYCDLWDWVEKVVEEI